MKLSIYTSSDALHFDLLSDTGFGGNTTYLRDPTVMKYSDGKYYVAYTDPNSASCCNPEDHFGIAVSADLVHWSNVTSVAAGVPNVLHVWAPEWFIDGGVVRIIANIDTGHSDFQPYFFTAKDSTLTAWSGPTALGIGADYIDTFVAKLGSTYHAFVKSELTRFLEHATAKNLTGPWSFVGKDDWAGWGNGLEGPTIVRLDDGRYQMYVDPQKSGPYQYMTSTDLVSWSAKASVPGTVSPTLRHGTVIRDEVAAGLAGNGGTGGSSAGAAGVSNTAGGAPGNAGTSASGGSLNVAGAPALGGHAGGDSAGGSAGGASSSASGSPGSSNGGGAGSTNSSGAPTVSGDAGSGAAAGLSSSAISNTDSSGCACRLDRSSPPSLGRAASGLLACTLLLSLRVRRRRASRH